MADSGMIIRPAEPEDIDRIMLLEQGSIAHPWDKKEIETLVSSTNKKCLLLQYEDRVVSYVGAEMVLDECNIGNIVTDREYRGKGFASALMAALLEELSESGIAKVFLEVEFDNAPAIALYERAGFERYGQRRDYYGRGRDAVLMSKALC
jgi:ribosomal-protein-alanine N-acetyltransferase